MTNQPILTDENGAPVADNQRSQSAGPNGPLLLQDHHPIEKLARFDRERIPERANIAGNLGKISRDDIIARAIGHFRAADADYGARLEAAIKAFRAKR
jgi:catalase